MKVLHLMLAISLATAVLVAGCAADEDDGAESTNGSTRLDGEMTITDPNGTNETNESDPPENGLP